MRIGIYGGTFNPVHNGHLSSAIEAVEDLELDKLLFVPAAIPPHKELPKGTPEPEQRLEMLKMAVDSELLGYQHKVEINDLELRREGPSYTSDTLRELKRRYPDAELYLLMGMDMFLSLDQWHEPGVVCALANIVCFDREPQRNDDAIEAQKRSLEQKYAANVRYLNLSGHIVEVSSTQIRKDLRRGKRSEELSVPVYGYILRRGLYQTNADLKHLTDDDLRACSLSMVYAKRHKHILGVEETAVKLAHLWGADPELARRAGILHDCTKYLPLQEHLSICDAAGIELDEMERSSEKLLHAKSGAAIARKVYGEPEEVYWAIFWHTTGRADMTLLEKIVYLADYMEPNRVFDGVDQLRRLCYTDLDAALEMGLEMSVADLNERGAPIHKNTQGALDWVRAHRKGTEP